MYNIVFEAELDVVAAQAITNKYQETFDLLTNMLSKSSSLDFSFIRD